MSKGTTLGASTMVPAAVKTYRVNRGLADAKTTLVQPRRRPLRHVLPLSSSIVLTRLLDCLDIKDCAHCEEMRFALIAFVKGLAPLAPDVVVFTDEAYGKPTRHLAAGVASI